MQSALKTKHGARAAMAIAAALAIAISGAPASAMGTEGDSAQKPAATGTDKPAAKPAEDAAVAAKCKTGQVWDPNAKTFFGIGKGKCVDAAAVEKTKTDKQGMIYDYGRRLAKAGEFERAIEALALAPDQGDPRVLNYLGYSSRKLGRIDEALGYYRAAIAQNPDFSLAREYLGEAYLQLGELENARGQLSEIERICGGRACGEYTELARLIVESQSAR